MLQRRECYKKRMRFRTAKELGHGPMATEQRD